jgi:hypothetical protein
MVVDAAVERLREVVIPDLHAGMIPRKDLAGSIRWPQALISFERGGSAQQFSTCQGELTVHGLSTGATLPQALRRLMLNGKWET